MPNFRPQGALRPAGVSRITPHELRRSCTEMYTEAGASTEDLRRVLNHKSLDAIRSYVHRTDARVDGLAATIRVSNLKALPVS